MQNLMNVDSADLAALRARFVSDVECPRCLDVSCVGQACRIADHGDVSDQDADLATVDAGSDAPMHVVREGVPLDVDEAQWRADNAVGLGIESQASFDARRAQGRAERESRVLNPAAFRRLPVLDEAPF